jgi:hypothetical protein
MAHYLQRYRLKFRHRKIEALQHIFTVAESPIDYF